MRIIGGKYRGKKLISPTSKGTRPTSDRTRETLFNILLHNPHFGPRVLIDKTVLDVFAGTGALGLEAFSRGATSVTFIENDKSVLPVLKANIKAFNLPPSSIIEQDGLSLSFNPKGLFDLIFMDPPYHQQLILPALNQLESKGWIGKKTLICIEIAKNENLSLPPQISLVLERSVSAAKLLFCILHPCMSKK